MSNNAAVEDYEIDPLTTEEKLVLAHEAPIELAPWEITEVVQGAMADLPPDFDVEEIDLIFDVIYEAVSNALERVRYQI